MTEEVTGLDLVEIALRIAGGGPLGIDEPPVSTGTAVQVRVNTETVGADGTVVPQAGTLTASARRRAATCGWTPTATTAT